MYEYRYKCVGGILNIPQNLIDGLGSLLGYKKNIKSGYCKKKKKFVSAYCLKIKYNVRVPYYLLSYSDFHVLPQ